MDWSIDAAGCTLGWVCVESGPAWTSLPANSGSSGSNLMGPGFMLPYLSAKSLVRHGPAARVQNHANGCVLAARLVSDSDEYPLRGSALLARALHGRILPKHDNRGRLHVFTQQATGGPTSLISGRGERARGGGH